MRIRSTLRRIAPALRLSCAAMVGVAATLCVSTVAGSILAADEAAAGPAGGAALSPSSPALPALPRVGLQALSPAHVSKSPGASEVRSGFAPAFRFDALPTGLARSFAPSSLSADLLTHMQREAEQYQVGHIYDVSGAAAAADSIAEDLRAQEAQRIATRAFNRTLDMRSDALARSTDGLGAALAWLEGLGSTGARSRGRGNADVAPGAGTTDPPRFRSHLGLRVGAHPSFVMGAAFGQFHGRIEVPILGEPLRVSLERPLGLRGRALFTSGIPRDGRASWSALSLSLRF